jgi:hypothetical protein
VLKWLRQLGSESLAIALPLYRIMVPVIIFVKVLQEVGAIAWIGQGLSPFMSLVGLPGTTGLIWATTMLSNLYSGMVVFVSLSSEVGSLSVAQVTVLTSMMLIAHNLPVELRIVQQAGPRLWSVALLRVGGALGYGMLLNTLYTIFDWNQHPAALMWTPDPQPEGLVAWAWGEIQNLGMVFGIVVALVLLMRALDALGLTRRLQRMLAPVLQRVGIGREATNLTVIGVTLGLAYGGGLILREAHSGRLSPRDIYFSLALMSLCHSAIEDTLLMLLLGADWIGVLPGRFLFGFLVIWCVVRWVDRLPEPSFHRWLIRPSA